MQKKHLQAVLMFIIENDVHSSVIIITRHQTQERAMRNVCCVVAEIKCNNPRCDWLHSSPIETQVLDRNSGYTCRVDYTH